MQFNDVNNSVRIASLSKICVKYLWQVKESNEAKKKKAKIKISMLFPLK
ncbi:MAG: hypothetical protein HFJ52_07125 [Clostridia bacterium]|nr:hypothetical protein [Clostridia bacterium]